MAGVNVPLHAAEHYYLITEPIEGLHGDLPIVEDPTRYAYYREEVGGLMLGLFEPIAGPWGMDGIPEDFSFGELSPDWDRLMPYIDHAMERIPIARDVGADTAVISSIPARAHLATISRLSLPLSATPRPAVSMPERRHFPTALSRAL